MIVPGHGPLGAKIMLIGEAPGEEEDRQGLPFVGASGKLLTQMLEAAKIERQACYLTNVLKLRPPQNNFSIMYEDKAKRQPSRMLLECYETLRQEIQQVRPSVICCLGGEALRAVTGRTGIDNWRGSILSTPHGKCVPTLHPAYVLRMYQARPIVELDLSRVREESASPELNVPSVTCETRPSFERVIEYLTKRPKRLAFDIETSGSHVRCLGLSSEVGHAICIPFIANPTHSPTLRSTILFTPPEGDSSPTSYWPEEQEYAILQAAYRLFNDPSVEKIAQNYPFDAGILAREFGLNFTNVYMDTMVAHHACYCELPKGLDFLCSIYTRIPYYSDYDVSSDEQTWRYNCYDAAVTFECSLRLEEELRGFGLSEFYFNQKHPTTLALVRVESRGVLVDTAKRSAIAAECSSSREVLQKQIQLVAGSDKFNPSSPKQVKELLYDKLKLPIQYHPRTRKPTTDKNALAHLRTKCPQHFGFLEHLELHSKLDDLLSGFLQKALGADGRIRTHFNSAATVTDRLNSSEPLFDPGTNLQNIPRRGGWEKIRACFIADPGWTWIKADLSQAEFRIVAWMAKIWKVVEEYQKNPKWRVHSYVASLAYKVPREQVTGQMDDNAKIAVHGGNYGIQAAKLAMAWNKPIEETKWLLEEYRKIFPEIPQWWEKVRDTINSTRTISGPFGNKRIFFDRLGDSVLAEIYRDSYSHSAQNIVANLVNRALHLVEESFDPGRCHTLLQVHDELDLQASGEPDSANVLGHAKRLKAILEYPLYFEGVPTPLVIPAEVSVGKNWLETRKVEL